MGARTWMVAFADGEPRAALLEQPALDRAATDRLAARLFPRERLRPLADGDLSITCPADDELCIGAFPGAAIVAAAEFGIDRPSRLPASVLAVGGRGTVVLHAMHSVVDWFAYAVWRDGVLVRALSLSPDDGILEDRGERLPFEAPFWAGRHPVGEPDEVADDPFPFHPLELGEAALGALFGYVLEGPLDASLLEPESIPLARFRRHRPPWWRFWG